MGTVSKEDTVINLLLMLSTANEAHAVIYTGNHYVVDLLIGAVYAAAALFGVRWLWRRLELPE